MRKFYLSLLLPLLMLLAQQGALWHEIGHVSLKASASQTNTPLSVEQQRELQSMDKLCESCLAFAQLAAVAKTEVLPLNLLSFGFGFARTVAVLSISADAPALRARGPPSFL